MRNLTWPQAISWHLKRQRLDKRVPRSKLVNVASELCGLHAQVMSSAELTAWCRVEGLQSGDVAKALWSDRTLVKTWAMRSTLHLLPAAELNMWLHVFALYDRNRTAKWLDYFGITAADLERVILAASDALRNRMLTRDELAEEIVQATGLPGLRDKLRQGWGSLLKPACHRGQLCFGPNRGPHVLFTHPGGSGISKREGDAAEALCNCARKYFAVYGPATVREFARWLCVSYSKAKELMQLLGSELEQVDVEGTAAFMLRRDVSKAARREPVRTVRLLPAFDQYVFAAGLRSSRLLPGDFHGRVYRTQGWFSAVLLVDGRLDGVWRFDRKGKRLAVTIEPFTTLPARVRRAAAEEAERLARFMGRDLELSIG
jgi:hypothetical protein